MVEKDTSWRRRVTKVFNKVESDFDTLIEYNNYLEEVEDISKCKITGEVFPRVSLLNNGFQNTGSIYNCK